MSTLSLLCAGIMESFDRHRVGGVKFEFTRSEVLVALRSEAEGAHLLHDFDEGARYGRKVDYALVDGSCARDLEPALTEDVAHALVVNDQAFVDPSAYVQALSASFQVRGGKVLEGCTAQTIGRARGRVVARLTDGETLESDAIVLASGAWLPHLARSHGLRTRMAPGRGFSFRIEGPVIPSRPIYFPAAKVATTPLGGRLGVAGMMEFGPIGTPAKAEHAVAIAQSIRPLLRDLNFESLADIWVGSRPLTADGLPVVGESRTPGVFLAGGHGMWGMTLGPHSGHLLAQQIMTGAAPIQLAGLEPTR
jgi:D-amino-acid dehydrogenase